MRRAALSLALVGLVLATLPTGRADNGLEVILTSDATPTASPSSDLVVVSTYQLAWDDPSALVLSSGVVMDGVALPHTAEWVVGGAAAGTTTRETFGSSPSPGQNAGVQVTWHLGTVSGGTLRLTITLQKQVPPGQATDIADGVAFDLAILPPSAGGGGGGGGQDDGSVGTVTALRSGAIASDSIMVVWNQASHASTYRVYRSQTSGFEPGAQTQVGTVANIAFTDTPLAPATTYHYRVRGIGDDGREGGISQQLSLRTLAGPDVTPPAAVAGLKLVKATAETVTLSWQAASDDGGSVAYQVHRGTGAFTPSATTLIGTSTALTFTDTSVSPAATYSYRVRAADGAGNVGLASDALEVVTLPQSQDDGQRPAILGLTLTGSTAGWSIAWSTDEPTTAQVLIDGPGAPRTLTASRDVGFNLGLGTLEVGLHTYTITATDDAGTIGSRSGTFRVGGNLGRYVALPPDIVAELAEALGTSASDLFLVDSDVDGRVDAFVDAGGSIGERRALPREGQFLVEARGRLALLSATGQIEAVQAVDGRLQSQQSSDAVRTATVRVDDKDGWILVTLTDPNVGLPLLGVERSDGTPLPDEAAWREGATLAFLDDPDVTYRVLYDNAGTGGSSGDNGGGFHLPPWVLWIAIGLGGLLLGVLVMALMQRRQRPPA